MIVLLVMEKVLVNVPDPFDDPLLLQILVGMLVLFKILQQISNLEAGNAILGRIGKFLLNKMILKFLNEFHETDETVGFLFDQESNPVIPNVHA